MKNEKQNGKSKNNGKKENKNQKLSPINSLRKKKIDHKTDERKTYLTKAHDEDENKKNSRLNLFC